MPAKLKLFRTVTGFHDAYVAAPSRAAALRAWGATTDLFAMDAAEQVNDPQLMAQALSRPGEVIKRPRGSDHEHLAAASHATKAKAKPESTSTPALKPKPRPSRAKLDKAEQRLEQADASHATEMLALEAEKAELRRREDAARRDFDAKRSKLDKARQSAADAYEETLREWRSS